MKLKNLVGHWYQKSVVYALNHGIRQSMFESCNAVGNLTPSCLCVLICKMKMVTMPPTKRGFENEIGGWIYVKILEHCLTWQLCHALVTVIISDPFGRLPTMMFSVC